MSLKDNRVNNILKAIYTIMIGVCLLCIKLILTPKDKLMVIHISEHIDIIFWLFISYTIQEVIFGDK